MNLDALSLDDESAGPGDVSAVPVLSDDDLPTAVCAEDWRQVIRICDVPPDVQVMDLSQDDQICDARLTVWRMEQPPDIPGGDSQQPVRVVDLPPEVQISVVLYLQGLVQLM